MIASVLDGYLLRISHVELRDIKNFRGAVDKEELRVIPLLSAMLCLYFLLCILFNFQEILHSHEKGERRGMSLEAEE